MKIGRHLIGLGLSILMTASASAAFAAGWAASSVKGTALLLETGKWVDITVGQSLPASAVVRTLGSGRLSLVGEGLSLAMGGNAALEISDGKDLVQLHHHAGAIAVLSANGQRVSINTPTGRVVLSNARVEIAISAGVARVAIVEGVAAIVDSGGRQIELTAGQTARVAAAGVSVGQASASSGSSAASGTQTAAAAGSQGAASSGNPNAGPGNSNAGGSSAGGGQPGNSSGGAASGNNSGGAASGNPNAGPGNNSGGGNSGGSKGGNTSADAD